MGTNFYIKEPTGDKIHIGKSSGGWRFIFRGYEGLKTWSDWKKKLEGSEDIFDEYGDQVSYDSFVKMVEESTSGKSHYQYLMENWRCCLSTEWEDNEGFSFTSLDFS